MDLLFRNYQYFFKVYFSVSILTFCGIYMCVLVVFVLLKRFCKQTFMIPVVALYFTILVVVTLFSRASNTAFGFIINPFYGILQIIVNNNIHFWRGMISNVLLFVPFGIIVYKCYGIGDYKAILFISAIASLAIESLQFFLKVGYFETGDILCNAVGALCGRLICRLFERIKTNSINQIE